MRKTSILLFKNGTLEDAVNFFANLTVDNYRCELEGWRSKALDDRVDPDLWEKLVRERLSILHQNTVKKLKNILLERKKFPLSFLRIFSIVTISTESGFYDDLLHSENDLRKHFACHISYKFDVRDNSIVKVWKSIR